MRPMAAGWAVPGEMLSRLPGATCRGRQVADPEPHVLEARRAGRPASEAQRDLVFPLSYQSRAHGIGERPGAGRGRHTVSLKRTSRLAGPARPVAKTSRVT